MKSAEVSPVSTKGEIWGQLEARVRCRSLGKRLQAPAPACCPLEGGGTPMPAGWPMCALLPSVGPGSRGVLRGVPVSKS